MESKEIMKKIESILSKWDVEGIEPNKEELFNLIEQLTDERIRFFLPIFIDPMPVRLDYETMGAKIDVNAKEHYIDYYNNLKRKKEIMEEGACSFAESQLDTDNKKDTL